MVAVRAQGQHVELHLKSCCTGLVIWVQIAVGHPLKYGRQRYQYLIY